VDPVRTLLRGSSASLTSGATLRALDQAREALLLSRGDELLELHSLDAVGAALWARGEFHLAGVVLGSADRLRQRTGQPQPPNSVADLVTASLGWEEGRRLPPEEIRARLSAAATTNGRPTSGWGSLTVSERKVVELAVEGLSNPRIAQKLFLSTNTVKTHLLRAYRKLGVRSRSELRRVPR
jgi:DNA-binding CsgD family transcriptional regulator